MFNRAQASLGLLTYHYFSNSCLKQLHRITTFMINRDIK